VPYVHIVHHVASAAWRRYVCAMTRHPSAIEEAERAGFDLSLIDANLSYSREKRVLLHDQALALALEFERVGRQLRGDSQSTPQRLSFLTNPDPDVEVRNLYLETELGAIDVLSSILGVGDFGRVRAESTEIEIFGRRCRVISLDDLIRAKEALGRERYATVRWPNPARAPRVRSLGTRHKCSCTRCLSPDRRRDRCSPPVRPPATRCRAPASLAG
jgi:hypothetical protein